MLIRNGVKRQRKTRAESWDDHRDHRYCGCCFDWIYLSTLKTLGSRQLTEEAQEEFRSKWPKKVNKSVAKGQV
jgi:hypothetical protein